MHWEGGFPTGQGRGAGGVWLVPGQRAVLALRLLEALALLLPLPLHLHLHRHRVPAALRRGPGAGLQEGTQHRSRERNCGQRGTRALSVLRD